MPAPAGKNALVYDAQSQRVLLGVMRNSQRFETWVYDFNVNTWTNMTLASEPRTNFFGAMAYDSESDRVILFGGPPYFGSPADTWAYDFNANTWTNMTSTSGPAFSGELSYDSESDRVILFGETFSETWAYDFNTNTWTNMTSVSGPSAGLAAAMVYDSKSDRVILFGHGVAPNPYEYLTGETWAYDFMFGVIDIAPRPGETWAYDFNTNTWTNMTSVSGPSFDYYHPGATAYDSESDRVIRFGGTYRETWAYDLDTNTWTNETMSSRPTVLYATAMAYDSASDRTILYGGWGETSSYDFNSNLWTDLIATPSGSVALAYDSESDRIIAHGPLTGTFDETASNTWAYDVNSDTWKSMRPLSPPLRGALAYDSESDRAIFLGTAQEPRSRLQTWAYDFNTNTWTNMSSAAGPQTNDYRLVYDSESDRIILFGVTFRETWAYDFNTNTWTDMTPASGPSARLAPAMVYDSRSDRVILFGGGVAPNPYEYWTGETWAYDFNTNTWTNMAPSSGPSPRLFHAMAYDKDHDRTILFGGRLRFEHPLGDTWAYDFNTNTWTNMAPLAAPQAVYLHEMVYDSESHLTVLFPSWENPGPWIYRYPDSAPASPRTLRATEGNRQVTLTWEAPSYDGGRPVTGYRIYRFTWPEGLAIVATLGLIHTYTDGGLANGVLYYYWVSALNAIGEGPLSGVAAATPRLLLSAPLNLQTAAGNSRIVLSWQAAASGDNSPITGYRIYRGASLSALSIAATVGPALTYLDTNVTNGRTYYYRVSAMSGLDEGPRSNEAVAMPRESTKPSVAILSPIERSSLTTSTIVISGTASDDTEILRVELSRDGTNWVTASGTASWSGTLSLLEGANTIYARATDTSGNTQVATITVTVLNPVVAALWSPVFIGAVVSGIALLIGTFVLRRWRDKRWEHK